MPALRLFSLVYGPASATLHKVGPSANCAQMTECGRIQNGSFRRDKRRKRMSTTGDSNGIFGPRDARLRGVEIRFLCSKQRFQLHIRRRQRGSSWLRFLGDQHFRKPDIPRDFG